MDMIQNSKPLTKGRFLTLLRRSAFSLLGVLIAGCGIGLLKRCEFGVDPFQVFATGIGRVLPLSFGASFTVLGMVLLLFAAVFDRHYIGIGTVIAFLLQGYVIDGVQGALYLLLPHISVTQRMVLFSIGFLLLCFAIAVYYCADQGVPAYDAIALIITNTWKKGCFRTNRVLTDLCCVILGCLMLEISGAHFAEFTQSCGLGTIVLAFGMGPVVDLFERSLQKVHVLSQS